MIIPDIFDGLPVFAVSTTKPDMLALSWDALMMQKEQKRDRLFAASWCPWQRAFYEWVHGDHIIHVQQPGYQWQGDAMITTQKHIALGVHVADCVPVLIAGYDRQQEMVIAVVHSWRKGTQLGIVTKTIMMMCDDMSVDMQTLRLWIGPAAQQAQYIFGPEAFDLFPRNFIKTQGSQHYVDVPGQVYQQIIDIGIHKSQVQYDTRCTIEQKNMFYSYRRDKTEERMIARIVLT